MERENTEVSHSGFKRKPQCTLFF